MNDSKIDASIWGPYAWHVLHNISINSNMNNTTKKNYLEFIQLFKHIIPCPICKIKLQDKCNMIPMNINTISNTNLIHWMHTIHNAVNLDTNKYECDYNKHIELHKNTNTKKYNKFVNILLNIMGDNPSFEDFIKIHSFIHSLYKVYPLRNNNVYKRCFKNYDALASPLELKKWFISNNIFI